MRLTAISAVILALVPTAVSTATAGRASTTNAGRPSTTNAGEANTANAGRPGTTAAGLAWHDCRRGPDDEQGQKLADAGATCATVKVPLDHTKPDGRTLDLAISRIKADPAKRRGILLMNPGGPGGPGLAYSLELRPLLKDVAAQYDLIGFDPRFVGRSSPITCGPAKLADLFRSSPTRAAFAESARRAREFAASCHARNPDVLPHAGIREVARDLDRIRQALNEPKLSYYGVSWGADLGVVYSQLFTDRVDRMVVDSVTDVEGSEYHHLATGERTEAAFDEWAAWAAWRDDRYHLGRTGSQIRAKVERMITKTFAIGNYKVDPTSLPFLLQSALGDESDRDLMATNVRTLLDAAAGRTVTPSEQLTALMAQYFGSAPELDQFAAASFAFTCNDRGWPHGPTQYGRDIQATRTIQPIFGAGILPCAYWQDHTTEPELRITEEAELLIVQAERDNIPLTWATNLHHKLKKSTLITVDRRAHGVFDPRVPTVVSQVNQYFSR